MGTRLTWHGHSNFCITHPQATIVIDPFFTGNPFASVGWGAIPPPDIVLVTHPHKGHLGDAVHICRESGAKLGVGVGTGRHLKHEGVPADQLLNGVGFNIGGTINKNGVHVTMTEAVHVTESGSPSGFIISMPDGVTIYHAGDTEIFANMALWGRLFQIDVALLPTGGFFTMDGRRAARAARMLRAKKVVPMHWGTFPDLIQDTREFEQELRTVASRCAPLFMEPGKNIGLRR